MHCTVMNSPVGPLTIAADNEGLCSLWFDRGKRPAPPVDRGARNRILDDAVLQLEAFFDKRLTRFALPLKPKGTPFQLAVWRELEAIPYGQVISYQELARRIGNRSASRAVGAANGLNPLPIVIPCHRVIGSNGKMVGYAGGTPIKEALLSLEGALACNS